jgi:hypothetical protein
MGVIQVSNKRRHENRDITKVRFELRPGKAQIRPKRTCRSVQGRRCSNIFWLYPGTGDDDSVYKQGPLN